MSIININQLIPVFLETEALQWVVSVVVPHRVGIDCRRMSRTVYHLWDKRNSSRVLAGHVLLTLRYNNFK